MVRKFIRRRDASKTTRQQTSALLVPLRGRKVKTGTPIFNFRGKLIGRKKRR